MLKPVLPLFEYIIMEDYIAQFLCINKDNTELQCNGKCYLMQRLAEENQNKKENLPKISMEDYPIGFVEVTSLINKDTFVDKTTNYLHYTENYGFQFSKNTFHPPNYSI